MSNRKSCVVREADVVPYHPANHTGTTNRRLIGPETVGARNLEVLLGVIEKNQGALPHAHPGIEQAGYMLAGRARVEIGSGSDIETVEVGPGDTCYFPPDRMHRFTVLSDEPVRILVMYAPPYLERPENVIR
jgi:uncharacterized RmlC-like cupin family protein